MTLPTIAEKLRDLGRAFKREVKGARGVEFVIFFDDGTRAYYNSRDDVEKTEEA